MKVLILAGGFGTRLSEETESRPKPMVEIGGYPILYHIMKIYSHYGYNDFIILLGYKGYMIKEYFANFFIHNSDVTIDLSKNHVQILNSHSENWKVTLVDTGLNTMTGGRIKRVQKYVGNETFMMTYGDGVSDININKLVDFHRNHGKYATVSAVKPAGRYGALRIGADSVVKSFLEKPLGDGSYVNGGFFVLEPEVFEYIKGDDTPWEGEPMERLTREGQLVAYKHAGFWRCMDTLRDKRELEELWNKGDAPWKVWRTKKY
jgi:glucose-1-phosphate cytidylyltransferase